MLLVFTEFTIDWTIQKGTARGSYTRIYSSTGRIFKSGKCFIYLQTRIVIQFLKVYF